MEQALEIWQQEKMPELKLKTPWYGYALGHWDEQDDALADALTKGDYFPAKKEKGRE